MASTGLLDCVVIFLEKFKSLAKQKCSSFSHDLNFAHYSHFIDVSVVSTRAIDLAIMDSAGVTLNKVFY